MAAVVEIPASVEETRTRQDRWVQADETDVEGGEGEGEFCGLELFGEEVQVSEVGWHRDTAGHPWLGAFEKLEAQCACDGACARDGSCGESWDFDDDELGGGGGAEGGLHGGFQWETREVAGLVRSIGGPLGRWSCL